MAWAYGIYTGHLEMTPMPPVSKGELLNSSVSRLQRTAPKAMEVPKDGNFSHDRRSRGGDVGGRLIPRSMPKEPFPVDLPKELSKRMRMDGIVNFKPVVSAQHGGGDTTSERPIASEAQDIGSNCPPARAAINTVPKPGDPSAFEDEAAPEVSMPEESASPVSPGAEPAAEESLELLSRALTMKHSEVLEALRNIEAAHEEEEPSDAHALRWVPMLATDRFVHADDCESFLEHQQRLKDNTTL
eukprot:gene14678-17342_t